MDINKFYIVGINHKKTDASVRGQFAINPEHYSSILQKASLVNVSELFVLSTCNRTEIYGLANNPDILISLLCSETTGSLNTFKELAYIKNGFNAIEHLFNVAAGLDSQILGDYEIIGQIKQATKFAKERGFIGTFTERLINVVLQSSKVIKSQTQLSGGTVSVSFAAVQFLRKNVTKPTKKKILLLGTGKIGRNTCKNLVDYLKTNNITLINRTEEKASDLANELGLEVAPYNDLAQHLEYADIVIVATNAAQPVIMKKDLATYGKKILIDLSIPNNIDPLAKELPNITLVNVDDLSRINDETLQKRMTEIPKAKSIIAAHIEEFIEWFSMRKNVSVLKAVKQKLIDMHQCNLFLSVYPNPGKPVQNHSSDTIQKVIIIWRLKCASNVSPGAIILRPSMIISPVVLIKRNGQSSIVNGFHSLIDNAKYFGAIAINMKYFPL